MFIKQNKRNKNMITNPTGLLNYNKIKIPDDFLPLTQANLGNNNKPLVYGKDPLQNALAYNNSISNIINNLIIPLLKSNYHSTEVRKNFVKQFDIQLMSEIEAMMNALGENNSTNVTLKLDTLINIKPKNIYLPGLENFFSKTYYICKQNYYETKTVNGIVPFDYYLENNFYPNFVKTHLRQKVEKIGYHKFGINPEQIDEFTTKYLNLNNTSEIPSLIQLRSSQGLSANLIREFEDIANDFFSPILELWLDRRQFLNEKIPFSALAEKILKEKAGTLVSIKLFNLFAKCNISEMNYMVEEFNLPSFKTLVSRAYKSCMNEYINGKNAFGDSEPVLHIETTEDITQEQSNQEDVLQEENRKETELAWLRAGAVVDANLYYQYRKRNSEAF